MISPSSAYGARTVMRPSVPRCIWYPVEASVAVSTGSTTIDGAWETAVGVEPGVIISLRVTENDARWVSAGFEVPTLLEPGLLSRLIGSFAVFVTTAAAYWLLRRTAHVWRRRPALHAGI